MRTRLATAGDISFLADVVVDSTRDQGRLPVDFDEPEFRRGFSQWTQQQIDGDVVGSLTYVVEVDGEAVGRLRVVRSTSVVEVAGLQILPCFQSRGIGTAVLEQLKHEVVETGARLELGVERDNLRARALYERLGFAVVGESEDEWQMRWTSDAERC